MSRNKSGRAIVRAMKAPDLYPPRRQTTELRRALDAVEEFGCCPQTLDLKEYLDSLDARERALESL